MHVHNDAFWDQFCDAGAAAGRSPGGIPLYLHYLVEAQRASGIQVSMIRFSPNPDRTADAPRCHVLQTASQRPRPAAHRRLYECVTLEDPDVVHLHSTYYAMNPMMMRRLRRLRPVVHTFHDVMPICFWHNKLLAGGELCERPVGYGCVTRGCYRVGATDRFARDSVRVLIAPLRLREYRRLPVCIVPSSYLRDQLVINGFRAERIKVLPLFSRFEHLAAPDLKSTEGSPPRILFVGRLVKDKGLPELVKALAILRDKAWLADIVGEGPLLEPTRNLIKECGLTGRISLAGNATTPELAEHYRRCDLVVFPSMVPESFGLVGLEAMTFGKPIVAFPSGGVRDWLEDGVNGLLAARGDVAELARCIRSLIDDPPLARRMGAAGQEMAKTRFTRRAHLDALIDVYNCVRSCSVTAAAR